MRFQNWDVLIFAAGDHAPLQEFRTACFAVQDTERLYGDKVKKTPVTGFRQLPIVGTFVPAKNPGSVYKVSVHTWRPPQLGEEVKAAVKEQNAKGWFEARVVVDGVCTASTLLSPSGDYPQVIDKSLQVDQRGQPTPLRWPPFHSEHLLRGERNPGDNAGRIKVTISEGFMTSRAPRAFARLTNIATFSFQHIPLEILEEANLAWPSKGMWINPQALYTATNVRCTVPGAMVDPELHSQSPYCSSSMRAAQTRMHPPPPPNFAAARNAESVRFNEWSDPFVDWRDGHGSELDLSAYPPFHERDPLPCAASAYPEQLRATQSPTAPANSAGYTTHGFMGSSPLKELLTANAAKGDRSLPAPEHSVSGKDLRQALLTHMAPDASRQVSERGTDDELYRIGAAELQTPTRLRPRLSAPATTQDGNELRQPQLGRSEASVERGQRKGKEKEIQTKGEQALGPAENERKRKPEAGKSSPRKASRGSVRRGKENVPLGGEKELDLMGEGARKALPNIAGAFGRGE